MTTAQIAERLADLCREGRFETAHQELYADDAISIEPEAMPGFEKETRGKDAIMQKGRLFNSMVEESFGCTVSDPLICGHSFAFVLEMDLRMKGKERERVSELCVYQVKDDQVAMEQFFM